MLVYSLQILLKFLICNKCAVEGERKFKRNYFNLDT